MILLFNLRVVLLPGTGELSVAAGKQNGGLIVWTVQNVSLASSKRMKKSLQKGRSIHLRQAHGPMALTAVILTQGPKSHQEGLPGFAASTGLDRDFKSWKPASDKVRSFISLR